MKKSGFSLNDSGVGGLAVEVPIARDGVGGVVGRKERRYDFGVDWGWSWMYCNVLLIEYNRLKTGIGAGFLTMCLLLGKVDNARLQPAEAVRAMFLLDRKDSIVLL